MRRAAIKTSVAATILALAAPGVAGAHSHHARQHQTGKRVHARLERFGPVGPNLLAGTGSANADPAGSASSEGAATVASFEGGVLTLTLNDGSTVRGKVTDGTTIKCEASGPSAHAADDGSGDQADSSGGGSDGEQASTENGRDQDAQAAGQDEQEDRAEQQDGAGTSCGTASLVPGAAVREAELRVSSSGSTFLDIELIA